MICASAVSACAGSPSRARRSASSAMASRTLSVASPVSRATSVRVRSVTVRRRHAAASCGPRSSRASRVRCTSATTIPACSPCPVSAASAARFVSARAIRDWSRPSPWSATRRDSCHASAAVRRSPNLAAARPRWLAASLSRCRSCAVASDAAGPSRSAARLCQSATVRCASPTQRRCRVPASSRTRTTTALAFASALGSVRRLATAASAVSALSRSRGSAPASLARSRSNHSAASPRASRSTGPSRSARQVRKVMSDSREALSVMFGSAR